jgi:hypothetical protein
MRLEERFWMKVNRSGSCWLWTAGTTVFGYGQFFIDGRLEGAHRVSWRLHFGNIPDDLCVLHRCDVPACVNPAHLFLGTKSDNARDSVAKGRWGNAEEDRMRCRYLVRSDNPPLEATGIVDGCSASICTSRAIRKAMLAVPRARWYSVRLDRIADERV